MLHVLKYINKLLICIHLYWQIFWQPRKYSTAPNKDGSGRVCERQSQLVLTRKKGSAWREPGKSRRGLERFQVVSCSLLILSSGRR